MGTPFSRRSSVFAYQQRVLPLLLGWGAGSVIAGLRWWHGAHAWWRGLGMQCVAWGAIDVLIALIGLRGAARKAAALAGGTLSEEAHTEEARKFERLLWINAGLDVLYILGGACLIRGNAARPERRGMGVGVIVQGLFLLAFDAVNGALVHRRGGGGGERWDAHLPERSPPHGATPQP